MSTSRESLDRVELIRRLFTAFPMGATEEQSTCYLQETRQIPLLHLAAGIARATSTLETKKVPAVATILRLVREVQGERIHGAEEQRQLEAPRHRPLTADELDQCRKASELGRFGLVWCLKAGAFVPVGDHWTAMQLHGTGIPLLDVTRDQILAAWSFGR